MKTFNIYKQTETSRKLIVLHAPEPQAWMIVNEGNLKYENYNSGIEFVMEESDGKIAY